MHREEKEETPIRRSFTEAAIPPFVMVLALWCVFWLGERWFYGLHEWGLYPGRWDSIPGIFLFPLLHGDLNHLINNSIPLLVLGSSLFYFFRPRAWVFLAFAWVVPGIFIWFFGRESYHIGASGMVYALASFIFFSGVFRGSKRLLALSMLVVFLYGSMVWGVLPWKEEISWEGHLGGAITGFLLALLWIRDEIPERREKADDAEEYLDDEDDDPIGDVWMTEEQRRNSREAPEIVYHYREKGKDRGKRDEDDEKEN